MAKQNRVNAAARREIGNGNAAPVKTGRKPKLGQNFLHDRGVAAKIVEALGDIAQRTVIEIGPGKGVLTDILVQRAGRLIAIELDRVLSAQLSLKYARAQNLEVIEADVLDVNFPAVLAGRPHPLLRHGQETAAKADVIGNLPYYITSDILLRLFESRQCFSTVVIMVQKEVADRLAAAPGSSDYGLLSATAQLYAKVEKLFTLPPGAFSPPPKVHSSVVRLNMSPQLESLHVEERGFINFLKLSFAQKRKTLWNNLRNTYTEDALREALREAGVKPAVRAETLPLEKSAAIYRSLASTNGHAPVAGK